MIAAKEIICKQIPKTCSEKGPQRLWRSHSDAVNKALLNRWLPEGQVENLLKTDLYDEAVSDGLAGLLASRARRVLYTDISLEVHRMAKGRHSSLETVGTDVRCLPFANGTFDGIISNSTLDHFESLDDMVTSLRELHRVLRQGGQMILTLDNLANPIILLRNWLPYRLLQRLNIIPYYMGITLAPHRLQHLLKEIGFKVLQAEAILHCPRVLAVAMAHWIEKYASPKTQSYFLGFLHGFEGLSRWPTRFLTGYFIAVRAIKPDR